jgi:hypothetical protein
MTSPEPYPLGKVFLPTRTYAAVMINVIKSHFGSVVRVSPLEAAVHQLAQLRDHRIVHHGSVGVCI